MAKQEKGFTIIEVLIVLAIAGLICWIAFLGSTCSCSRNSRNTQRKNDVSSILGCPVAEWRAITTMVKRLPPKQMLTVFMLWQNRTP